MGDEVGKYVVVDFVGGGVLAVGGEEEGADVAAEVCESGSMLIERSWRKSSDTAWDHGFRKGKFGTYFWLSSEARLPGRMIGSSQDRNHAKKHWSQTSPA